MAVMRTNSASPHHTGRTSRRALGTAVAAALTLSLGAALPAATAADGAQAQGVIANAGATDTIADSYLVVLHDDKLAASSKQAENLAERYDAEITHTYEHVLNGYAIEATQEQALAFAADPAVDKVVQDTEVELTATQTNPPSWGLDRIDQPNLPLDNSYSYPDHGGAGVTVYVIDTGVRYSHNEFGSRASFGFDAFGGNGADGNGHGTHVAATAAGSSYGVAKNADIVSVRVLNDSGSGTTSGVIAGVDWVTDNASGPSVANMSLGGGANALLDQAVQKSIAENVTYAVAAGNDYGADAGNGSPARVTEAITVASSTITDARSSFSNIGPSVQIFAPGSDIPSAWHTSDSAVNTISGTSMASPHVAGAAALHLGSSPTDSPAQVWAALDAAAVTGVISNPGAGTPNKLLQVP